MSSVSKSIDADPQLAPYCTADTSSFAYPSARDRWPVILTGALDDVHRTTAISSNEQVQKEGKAIVEALGKLKYEMQHDRNLTPLPDDGKPDIKAYNDELELLNFPTWFNVSWLYAECYLYRRISTLFALSTKWKSYDPFSRQKLSTFKSSRPAILELATRYKELITQLGSQSSSSQPDDEQARKAEETIFHEMCEICLWGNATDLSLLTNLTYEEIQQRQGSSARKAAEANILVNDLALAFNVLKDAKRLKPDGDRRVDIVLDNAGFELFVDLILAGYLLASGLATTIVLHPKSIPWFVSDVIPADFGALLNALADPREYFESSSPDEHNSSSPLSATDISNLGFLFDDWSSHHGEGNLLIRPNHFWTQAGGYWRMPHSSPALYADLKESDLVIFKGDLNYRKLTGDVAWPATTPFQEAIGPLGNGSSGIRVLALRTCKADVVVGLLEGQDEKLRQSDGPENIDKRKWAWSGKWAVVQFCNGKT